MKKVDGDLMRIVHVCRACATRQSIILELEIKTCPKLSDLMSRVTAIASRYLYLRST
jgi:hypothetical protein